MERRNRRDVGGASATGAALVAATLAFGHVFAPAGPSLVRPAGSGLDGSPIAIADGARARAGGTPASRSGRGVTGSGPSAAAAPAAAAATGAAGATRADATADGSDGRDRGGADGSVGGRGTGGAPAAGAADRGPSGADGDPAAATPGATGQVDPAPRDEPTVGDDGTLITAAVRLRVTDLSVTGTDSGTLRAGSEVRVRLATERETVTSGASTTRPSSTRSAAVEGPAAGVGTAAESTVPEAAAPDVGVPTAAVAPTPGTSVLPGRLDVRIRLDDAAVAALGSTADGATGPLALRALVDLVDPQGAGPYEVRVRMQLAPAAATRAAVEDGTRTGDGVSNVVAVVTPIGEVAGGGTPSDGGMPPGDGHVPSAPAEPVEVRVALPTGDAATTPDDGASVPVPIPADAAPPTGEAPGQTTADAAVVVHLPADDEPIGGTPEDLAVPPAPVPDAGPAPAVSPDADATPVAGAVPDAGATSEADSTTDEDPVPEADSTTDEDPAPDEDPASARGPESAADPGPGAGTPGADPATGP